VRHWRGNMRDTSLSGRTRDESDWPARSARRDAKSELAQVRAHHGFVHSDRTRARQLASSPSRAPGTNTPNAPSFLEREFLSWHVSPNAI